MDRESRNVFNQRWIRDTLGSSHWVEIYRDNDSQGRLEDVRLETLEDLEKLIGRLKRTAD
jgi:hypothetical protein